MSAYYGNSMLTGIDASQGQPISNDSLVALNNAWVTEANAPEILPYKTDIVEELQGQLTAQQEEIDKRIDAANPQEYFIVSLYQMDIERVRYSLARYLRTRILKIERNIEYIVSDIDIMDRLSMQEKVYATKLNSLNNSHFEDNVSGRLQSESAKEFYEVSENRQNNSQPSMQEFVFCKANVDVQDLAVSTDTYQNLSAGDISIMQYSVIREHVINGDIELL